MSLIESAMREIEAIMVKLQQEIATATDRQSSLRKKRKTGVASLKPSDLETAIERIERIRSGLKSIQTLIEAETSPARAHSQPSGACTQQQPLAARVSRLRPRMSVPRPAMAHPGDDSRSKTLNSSTNWSDSLVPAIGDSRRASCEDPIASPSHTRCAPHDETTQTLRIDQMGPGLVDNLRGLIDSDSFSGKITIEDLYDIDWATVRFDKPKRSEQCAVEYKSTSIAPGCVRLDNSPEGSFRLLDFSKPTEYLSSEEAWKFLDQIVQAPPEGPLSYYTGPQLLSTFGELLHPGSALAEVGQIEGINSVFDHIGEKGSGTAIHHEDALLLSCNITIRGRKGWLIIRKYHTKKFEDYIRTFIKDKDNCDQFVRHQGLLISPSELHNQNIDFDIHCTMPGDLIVTKPRQYHLVWNITDCYAKSMNFLYPGEEPFPNQLSVCEECGLYDLYHHGKLKFANKRSEIRKYAAQILEQEPFCVLPKFDFRRPPNPKVFKLAALLHTKAVIFQFIKLVTASRQNGNCRVIANSDDPEERLWQHISNLKKSEAQSDLRAVLRRYDQLLLFVDYEKALKGQQRASPEYVNNICQKSRWTTNQFAYNRRYGQAWKYLTECFNGIVCFIPTSRTFTGIQVSKTDYATIAHHKDDLEDFKQLLSNDHILKLCAAGQAFQESHMGSELHEFRWETENIEDLTSMSMEEILPYISTVRDTR
ncbi:hypothetical protein QQS21_004889 [Conoideocrella luteorostrata]|uniref:JmjC domain-containing protein n=1 Tax=Conoideocrella luteorostrata TaxID=1105319 RepID=A0AAJ0CQN6_9HYPO|nr:hypothetical protein QQS21_004889 [Conoideocrella luteorostrata]